LELVEPDGTRQTWLPLRTAADLLGVSESTVRRWADAGDVRSFRTRGGHRRILREDLQLILTNQSLPRTRDADRISDIALARVKRRLSRGREGHSLAVLDRFAVDERERLRLLGRQMVDLFARYIASSSKGERFTEDARTVGREYGRTLVETGVGLTSAISIFNSMRRPLEETASQIAVESGLSAEDAVEAVESTLGLADAALEGMAEVYESRASH
jgi:excisionase family DNA binding protein